MTFREDKHGAPDNRRTLARYVKSDSVVGDNRELARMFLFGTTWVAILTPLLFYLQFGRVDWFAIGFTIFLVVLCLLIALGLFFQTRTAYHTAVPLKSNLADRVGAFWLVSCAFGPFFGWVLTAPTFMLTAADWRWLYLARVFLGVAAPVITAIPLLRYARGKAALIALPLLIVITSLPVITCPWVIGDLHDGARTGRFRIDLDLRVGKVACVALDQASRAVPCDVEFARIGKQVEVTWLPHTGRVIEVRKL